MITPLDIKDKDFSKALRGYNIEEVDEFLNQIILDLSALQDKLDDLESSNEILRRENEEYKKAQSSVVTTLDTAKKLMKDISESAEKRADIIIRNAKLDADMIVKDARDGMSRYSGEARDLRDRISYFRSRYKQMLQDELAHLDDKGGDLLSDLEREFMPASIIDTLPESEAADAVREGRGEQASERAGAADDSAEELFREFEKNYAGRGTTVLAAAEDKQAGGASYTPKETVTIDRQKISELLRGTGKRGEREPSEGPAGDGSPTGETGSPADETGRAAETDTGSPDGDGPDKGGAGSRGGRGGQSSQGSQSSQGGLN